MIYEIAVRFIVDNLITPSESQRIEFSSVRLSIFKTHSLLRQRLLYPFGVPLRMRQEPFLKKTAIEFRSELIRHIIRLDKLANPYYHKSCQSSFSRFDSLFQPWCTSNDRAITAGTLNLEFHMYVVSREVPPLPSKTETLLLDHVRKS